MPLLLVLCPLTGAQASVEFDAMTWYDSHSPSTMFINSQGHLEWTPYNDHQILVRIPDQQLSSPGDVVQISYYWLSDGQGNIDGCDDCQNEATCNFNKDITCVSGTGDFRVGLFESDANYVTADGMGIENDIFRGYKGYKFCMQPHVPVEPVRWQEASGEPHIAGGFYERDMVDDPRLLSVNEVFDRISMYGGFDLPLGQFSLWTIRLKRLSTNSVEMTITLNGLTYTDIDTTNTSAIPQPDKIDVFVIEFPNPNPYSRIVLAPVEGMCESDFNLDGIIDEKDLSTLTADWLDYTRWVQGEEPDPNCLELYYDFDGTIGTDIPDGLTDNTGTYTAAIISGTDPDSTIRHATANPVYSIGSSAQFTNNNWNNDAGDTFLVPDTGGLDFSGFDEFTAELFVYPTSEGSGNSRRLFSEYINACLYLDSTDTLHAYRKWAVGSEWDSYTAHLTAPDFPLDAWSHVAVTWDSNSHDDRLKLYIDGQLTQSAPGTPASTLDSSAGFAIGGYQRENATTAQFFTGRIDEFKLYNCALTENEIAWEATGGLGTIIYLDSQADLHYDHIIDFLDFATLAQKWMTNCPEIPTE